MQLSEAARGTRLAFRNFIGKKNTSKEVINKDATFSPKHQPFFGESLFTMLESCVAVRVFYTTSRQGPIVSELPLCFVACPAEWTYVWLRAAPERDEILAKWIVIKIKWQLNKHNNRCFTRFGSIELI